MPSRRNKHRSRFQKNLRVKNRKLSKWIHAHRRIVGIWFLLVGFLLTTFPPAYKTLNVKPLETQPLEIEEIIASSATSVLDLGPIRIDDTLLGAIVPSQPPLRIVVPQYNVDLPIVEAPVVNGYWELSETTASHGVGSANPGEVGNTVIFAHARERLFLPIRNIKVGETVYVLTKDRWYRYTVAQTQLVDASQVETIAPTPDETLTLFTCSGFLDTKRLIVVAKPLRP